MPERTPLKTLVAPQLQPDVKYCARAPKIAGDIRWDFGNDIQSREAGCADTRMRLTALPIHGAICAPTRLRAQHALPLIAVRALRLAELLPLRLDRRQGSFLHPRTSLTALPAAALPELAG